MKKTNKVVVKEDKDFYYIQNPYLKCIWGKSKGTSQIILNSQPKMLFLKGQLFLRYNQKPTKFGFKSEVKEKNGEINLSLTSSDDDKIITIENILYPDSLYLIQRITIQASKKGKLFNSYYDVESNLPFIFIPTRFGYLGKVDKMPKVNLRYPTNYPLMMGEKTMVFDPTLVKGKKHTGSPESRALLRTPAIATYDKEFGSVVGAMKPYPLRLVIDKDKNNNSHFKLQFDKPVLTPDTTLVSPELIPGEELKFSLFIHPYKGIWKEGMKTWMNYVKEKIIKDDTPTLPFVKNLKFYTCTYREIRKEFIDNLAKKGLKVVVTSYDVKSKVKRVTPSLLKYAHSKEMKILIYVGAFCVPNSLAKKHPDWCILNEKGSMNFPSYPEWLKMDPNVKAYRDYRVKEAEEIMRQGYDGIFYDGLLYYPCFSKKHKHTMTFAEATMLMLKEVKKAIREINSEAIFLHNNWGPDLFGIADLQMSESTYYTTIGGDSAVGGRGFPYEKISNRVLSQGVIWNLMGTPQTIFDYPGPEPEKQWSNIIFAKMHDIIWGGTPYTIRDWEGHYNILDILNKVYSPLTENPISEIIKEGIIIKRLYRDSILLLNISEKENFDGRISLTPRQLRSMNIQLKKKYRVFSLKKEKEYCCLRGKEFKKIPVILKPREADFIKIKAF